MPTKSLLYTVLLSFIFLSCSSSKFNKRIENINPEYSYKEIYSESSNHSKKILKKLKAELSHVTHIAILYIPQKAISESRPYSSVLYDFDNNLYYFIEGYDKNISYIQKDIKDTSTYYKVIFDSYFNRDLADLIRYGEIPSSYNIFAKEAIIDISLNDKSYFFVYNSISNEDIQALLEERRTKNKNN